MVVLLLFGLLAGWGCTSARLLSSNKASPDTASHSTLEEPTPAALDDPLPVEETSPAPSPLYPQARAADHYLFAHRAESEGNWREATSHLRLALVTDPRQARLHRELSRLLFFLDRHSESLREATLAMELDFSDEASRQWLEELRLLIALGGSRADRQHLTPPDFSSAPKRLLAARLAYSDARLIRFLQKSLINAAPNDLAHAAWISVLSHHPGEADIFRSRALVASFTEVEPALLLALKLAALPVPLPAITTGTSIEQALVRAMIGGNVIDTLDLLPQGSSTDDLASRTRTIARLLINHQAASLGLAVLDSANPSDPDALWLRVQATLILHRDKDAAKALTAWEPRTEAEALQRSMFLAALSERLGSSPPATLKKTWLSPDNGPSPCPWVDPFRMVQQATPQAISFLQKASTRYPDDPACLVKLAALQTRSKLKHSALESLNQAVKRFPHQATPYLARGLFLLDQDGPTPQARIDLQRAALLSKQSRESLLALALFHEKAWNPVLSWKLFTLVLADDPNDPLTLACLLAFAHRQAKHPTLAKAMLNALHWLQARSPNPSALKETLSWQASSASAFLLLFR